MRKRGFVYSFLIWFIAFAIGIFFADFLSEKLNLQFSSVILKTIVTSLFFGIIIEFCSKVMQVLVLKRKFKINLYFLFWVVVQSICFWLSFTVVGFLNEFLIIMSYKFLFFDYLNFVKIILIAVLQVIFVRTIWTLRLEDKLIRDKRNRKKVLVVFLLIVAVLVFVIVIDIGGINRLATGNSNLIRYSSGATCTGNGFIVSDCEMACSFHNMKYVKYECIKENTNDYISDLFCYCK